MGQIDYSVERPLWAEVWYTDSCTEWDADVGEIKEVGAGYTFFWSGRKN